MNRNRIHLVANSHIDPVWLWDRYEGIDEVINTFRSACDRLDEYPELRFSASSTCFYKWTEEYAPAVFQRVREHVQSGRWEVTGGWWVETDCNLPSASSFRKSSEASAKYLRERLGTQAVVGYSPDAFGHPATLPMLLAEAGLKYYVFCRPDRRENPDLPSGVFYWEYEGARVLCYRVPFHYTQGPLPTAAIVDAGLASDDLVSHGLGCFMFGVGNHGGGPTKEEIDHLLQRKAEGAYGELVFSTCVDFFHEAEQQPDIPIINGDLHMHAVGCYSVNRGIKEGIRRAERSLCYAERALNMSGESGAGLDPLWKTTVFNEFHDIMPGSCAPDAAAQAVAELGGVYTSALDASYGALKRLSSTTPVERKEGEFRITNTLPHPVTGPFEIESWPYFKEGAEFMDSDGRAIEIQELPPSVLCMNHRWLFVDTIPAQTTKRYHFSSERTRETPAHGYAFEAGDSARIGEFTLSAGMVDAGSAPLFGAPIRLGVIPDSSDTWSHGVFGFGEAEAYLEQTSCGVSAGPLMASLVCQYAYGTSRAELAFRAYKELGFVDMSARVWWEERNSILKIEIPLPAEIESLTAQGPGGAIAKRRKGIEEPLHGWLITPGMTILQNGAFAFDWSERLLRVTLVRSSLYGYADGWQIDELGCRRPTDVGEHEFRFRFVPGGVSPEEADRMLAGFEEPFRVLRENAVVLK